MKVIAILSNGEFKVHKAGCSDVTKLVKKGRVNLADLPTFEAADQTAVVADLWSDIISEAVDNGDDVQDTWTGCATSTTFLACTKGLEAGGGFEAYAAQPTTGEPEFKIVDPDQVEDDDPSHTDAEAPTTDEPAPHGFTGDTTDAVEAATAARWQVLAFGANDQRLYFAERGERMLSRTFVTDEQVATFVAANLVSAWAPLADTDDGGSVDWRRRAVKRLVIHSLETGAVVQEVEPQAVKAARRAEVTTDAS